VHDRALHKQQAAEKLAAGAAYADSGYVAADELGAPLHPERISDEFGRLASLAQLPKIRLHDTRATMNTILEQAGVAETLRVLAGTRSPLTATATWAHDGLRNWPSSVTKSARSSGPCDKTVAKPA
jgi:hypothetical protein